MPDLTGTTTIFVRDDAALPMTFSMQSQAFLPGWRAVKDLDRQTLAREVERANWNLFYLAGETRATVFGRKGLGALRRAVKCVLAKQRGRTFNSLEVTKVVSRRFLGFPFLSVTVHSRHIQQDGGLVPGKDFVLKIPLAPR